MPKRAKQDNAYLQSAFGRAKRRKSPWNLVLFILIIGNWPFITYYLVKTVWFLRALWYHQNVDDINWIFTSNDIGWSGVLLSFPLLIAAMIISMIIANCITWLIPPLRRIYDREAAGVKGASFIAATGILLKIAAIAVPICLLLSFIGAIATRR